MISVQMLVVDEAAMLKFGQYLAVALKGHGSVFIYGQLGAGKTTLCRGILRAMGHSGAVKSPTFTLVEPYSVGGCEVFHFDLYRLSDPSELEYIGIDEYFGEAKLCLVEWPQKGGDRLPAQDLEISIDVLGEKRNICVQARSLHGEAICQAIQLLRSQIENVASE